MSHRRDRGSRPLEQKTYINYEGHQDPANKTESPEVNKSYPGTRLPDPGKEGPGAKKVFYPKGKAEYIPRFSHALCTPCLGKERLQQMAGHFLSLLSS